MSKRVHVRHNLGSIVVGTYNGTRYTIPPGDGAIFDDIRIPKTIEEDFNSVAVNKVQLVYTLLEPNENIGSTSGTRLIKEDPEGGGEIASDRPIVLSDPDSNPSLVNYEDEDKNNDGINDKEQVEVVDEDTNDTPEKAYEPYLDKDRPLSDE